MATLRDTRSYGDRATSDFPKMDRTEADVTSVSGAPSANTQRLPRDRSAVTAPPPGRPLRHRRHVEIDARTTGPALGRFTEGSPAHAARHLDVKETAARAGTGPMEQEYLDHVFGLNLPMRGRARAEGETSWG